jgi:Branched-chain amino acid transport system / permease component
VPSLAGAYTLLAFTIVIIGGLGSMTGALVGGLLIGVSEALAGFLIEPSMKSMFSFALLIVVLVLGRSTVGVGSTPTSIPNNSGLPQGHSQRLASDSAAGLTGWGTEPEAMP